MRRWGPPIVWAAFILVLTSLPGLVFAGIAAPANSDKVVHFILYAVLGALAVRAALPTNRWVLAACVTLAAIALFGAADEWHQQLIAGRSMDVHDWIADTAGALTGAAAIVTLTYRRWTA